MADQDEVTKMDGKNVPTLKVIILGERNVGKSTLLYRYKNGKLPPVNLLATVGVDTFLRKIDVEGKTIKLEIWDPSGQERQRKAVTPMLYRGAEAVIFVYDITDRSSFFSLKSWIDECKLHDINMESIPVVLLANMCDLRDDGEKTQVKYEEGEQYAKGHNMIYYETSIYPIEDVRRIEDVFIYVARIFKFSHLSLQQFVKNDDDIIKPCKADLEKKSGKCCEKVSGFFKNLFGLS